MEHVDGDIGDGLRGLMTSVVSNTRAFLTVVTACALGAGAGWAFVPGLWEFYRAHAAEARPPSLVWPVLVSIAAFVATALPIGLQFHKEWVDRAMAEEKTEEKAELLAFVTGYLSPCIEQLPQVALGGAAGREALAMFKGTILGTVQQICGPDGGGVRAVRFEVERGVLMPKDWKGGSSQSKRRFTKRDPAGAAAWERAKTGLPHLFEDLSKTMPEGFQQGPTSSYQTFITCGVLGTNGEVVGMLNVDAPKAHDLTAIDRDVVGVCARLLGTAYELATPRATL